MFHVFIDELQKNGSVRFYVRVRPRALYTRAVSVMDDESIKIDIAAPAQEDKANTELVRYLAEEFIVQKEAVSIVSGKTSRIKLIAVSLHAS